MDFGFRQRLDGMDFKRRIATQTQEPSKCLHRLYPCNRRKILLDCCVDSNAHMPSRLAVG